MVMMVVMVVMIVAFGFNMAVFIVAVLALGFKLKCCVPNSVLFQFFAHCIFNFVMVGICNNVHSGKIIVAIHTPNVNVVNIIWLSGINFSKDIKDVAENVLTIKE